MSLTRERISDFRMYLFLVFVLCLATTGLAYPQKLPAIVGIDHIPLAVRDLDAASKDFEQLGFSVKAGRLHANGIRNNHIKFLDGSGLELITASTPTDDLSTFYSEHLERGEGPAFLSFHVRDTARLVAALTERQIAFRREDGVVTFDDPRLSFVFFVSDNRSPTDRPEHFAHANGAVSMSEVWIALRDRDPLAEVLLALGSVAKKAWIEAPELIEANVIELENGRIVIVPERHQIVVGRPVIGVVMATRSRRATAESAAALGTSGSNALVIAAPLEALIKPKNAHGIWLQFRPRVE